MNLLLSFLLIQHYMGDTIPEPEIYDAPYLARFSEYKDRDSLTVEQLINAGPLICDNKAFEVVSFRWSESGSCFTTTPYREIKGNRFPAEDIKNYIQYFRIHTDVMFDMIVIKNRSGRLFYVRTFDLKIVEAKK